MSGVLTIAVINIAMAAINVAMYVQHKNPISLVAAAAGFSVGLGVLIVEGS